MAHNQGYYQGQGLPVQQQQQQQSQYSPIFQQHPQNIYQQLGKPQPQPHLQSHSTFTVQQPQQQPIQAQGFQFTQQQYVQPPAQIQAPYALSQTPYSSPQAPYQPSHTPYIPAQTPFASAQTQYQLSPTPYAQSQPQYAQQQPQQYAMQQNIQPVYQQQQLQQQPQQQLQQPQQLQPQLQLQTQPTYPPISSFPNQSQSAIPLNSSGSSWRPASSKPPPISPSASLAQQARASLTPITASARAPAPTPSQTPGRRPLPQPSPGANAQPPTLPSNNTPRRVPTLPSLNTSSSSASGSSGPFSAQPIRSIDPPSAKTPSPTRSRPLPTPASATTPNKRVTVDLGKLPHGASATVPSLGPISGFANSTASSSSNAAEWAAQKRTPSPTKSGLPAPPSPMDRKAAENVGLSRTASYAITNNNPSSPTKRRASPPRFHSQSNSESSSSSPIKENPPAATPWNISRSTGTSITNTATANSSIRPVPNTSSAGPGSISPTPSSSDANPSSNTTTTPKKFTPMWRRTIAEMPAPAWGYAAGMVSEPHPKPKPPHPPMQPAANLPSAAAAAAPAAVASLVKGKGKLLKKNPSVRSAAPAPAPVSAAPTTLNNQYPSYSQPIHPVQPQKRHPAYQQQQQQQQQQPLQAVQYGHGRAPANYAARGAASQPSEQEETEDDDDEEDEETEEDEEGEEEEEEETDESESDQRYAQQAIVHARQYSQGQAQGQMIHQQQQNHATSRPRYAEYEPEEEATPKKKVLRPKAANVDPYTAYIDVSPIGSKGRRIAEKSTVREREMEQERAREAAPKTKLRPKIRSRAFEEAEEEQRMMPKKRIFREVPLAGDGPGRRHIGQHERSRSAFEERDIIRHRREPSEAEKARRPGSALIAGERRARRTYEDDFDDVRLAYDDSEEEEEEEEEIEWKGTPKRGTPIRDARDRNWDRREIVQHRQQDSSPQYGIRNLPPALNRRAQSGSAAGTRYDYDQFEGVEHRASPRRPAASSSNANAERRYREPEPERQFRSPIAGLPQPPAMIREAVVGENGAEKRIRGGAKMKTAPLKHDDYDEAQHYARHNRAQEDGDLLQKFSHMKMNNVNGTRTDSRASAASSGAWPVDLPRLPRTPGSATTPGAPVNDGTGYFDVNPHSNTNPNPSYHARPTPKQSHTPSRVNLNLDDTPPRSTVIRTPSPGPGGGYTLRRELPQPQGPPQGRPQSQVYPITPAKISEQQARRRSLYSAPTAPIYPEQEVQQLPQSQAYDTNAQIQSSFGQVQPTQSFSNQLGHPPFNNTRMQQTPAPPPTVGIESPHPVGGREKMADIPKMEEDSNDGSDTERRTIPRINFESPQKSRAPRIQVNAPMINVNSAPHVGQNVPMINVDPPMIHVDSGGSPRKQYFDANQGPKIQVYEVPGVSVSAPEFDDHPSINISGPDDHREEHSQGRQQRPPSQSQMGHNFGAQPRSGGLVCGGCHGPIIGRIVSAMGQRYHPACFKCTVCNELLEHVSSYEHEGHPYCHLDYHENFAPRCYSCKTAIVEEQFISLDDPALGKRAYHTQHFFCAECGDPFLSPSGALPTDSKGELALSGDGEFEGFTVYKGHPYCESCHVRLRLPKCKRCKRSIRDNDEAVEALGGKWCWGCFICASCNKPFEDPSFFQRGDQPYCEHCFSVMLRNEI